MDISTGNQEILLRLMSASSDRAKVIAHNVANQNTPGYRRQVLHFEQLVGKALQSGRDPLSVSPSLETDEITPSRADGNNVNLELEMNAMRQNRLLYESYATILNSHFEVLRTSIESGR